MGSVGSPLRFRICWSASQFSNARTELLAWNHGAYVAQRPFRSSQSRNASHRLCFRALSYFRAWLTACEAVVDFFTEPACRLIIGRPCVACLCGADDCTVAAG